MKKTIKAVLTAATLVGAISVPVNAFYMDPYATINWSDAASIVTRYNAAQDRTVMALNPEFGRNWQTTVTWLQGR